MTKLLHTTTVMYRKANAALTGYDETWALVYPIVGITMLVGIWMAATAGDFAYAFVFLAGAWLATTGIERERERQEDSDDVSEVRS